MSRPQSLLRRWAIPLATLPVLCTVVFAFSLGPSPRKSVADYLRSPAPLSQRTARLQAAGDGVIVALAERIHETTLPRRDEAIAYLGRAADYRAMPALERLLNTAKESPEIRKMAFEAALAIDRSRGLVLAEAFTGRSDVLGQAARRALERQERSQLVP